RTDAFNVVGRIRSTAPESRRLPGVVVVGAHYDHLGMGGHNSLAPQEHTPHLGADDNASGVAAMLEIARGLSQSSASLRGDVVMMAFAGEEEGVLGSTDLTHAPPPGLAMKDVAAMINLDMVGRMRANHVSVLGAESADEWAQVVQEQCARARVECSANGGG